MAKNEFDAKNGTLSINEQTIRQREKNTERFAISDKNLGVGGSARALFSESPVGIDSVIPSGRENIYQTYVDVIDNDSNTNQGFGFKGIDYAYMNYNHPNNPFKAGDSIDYNSLTSAEKYENKKSYKGFPDLLVEKDAINDPSSIENRKPESNLTLEADGSTYGHDTNEYRQKIPGLKGKHVNSNSLGNGDIDTLGQYFRKNFIEE